jgi:hypothetical protein
MIVPSEHHCGGQFCGFCKKWLDKEELKNHTCWIRKPRTEVLDYTRKMLFFDIETEQNEESGTLSPLLICCFVVCMKCINNFTTDHPVKCCGERFRQFWGKNSIADFVDYLFFGQLGKVTVLSHCGGK